MKAATVAGLKKIVTHGLSSNKYSTLGLNEAIHAKRPS
ncbi:MAG: hypothetical protein ACI87E_003784, partial [Mariniblastus sp.]